MPSDHPAEPGPARHARRSRRVPFLWAVVALVVWLTVGGVLGPFASKLSSVQKNDNASFLPTTAESTEVNNLSATFSEGGKNFPVFVVFSRGSGLTPADASGITAFTKGLPGFALTDDKGTPVAPRVTVGDYLNPTAPAAIPSQDGKAVLITASLDADKVSVALPDGKSPLLRIVQTMRLQGAKVSPGLESHVTGVAGLIADLFASFGSLDTSLLGITVIVVAVILILVYRSPVLWLLPLLSAFFALGSASGVVYLLAKHDVLTLNGQSQGILTVLVFGAATDYALLLVARYREELHHHESRFDAVVTAWRGVIGALVASAATVCLGLLCLLFSELNSNKSTGPVAAIGIVCALLATTTFLPAALSLPGRWIFWPRIPRFGAEDEKLSGLWSRVAAFIGRRSRAAWVVTTVVLLGASFFATTLRADGISQTDAFTSKPDSVVGQEVLGRHFPAGSGNPALVIARADSLGAVVAAAKGVDGVASVVPYTGRPGLPTAGVTAEPKVVDGLVQVEVTLSDPADSKAAQETVLALRGAVHALPGADAKVGGFTAINLDTQEASRHDRQLIIPIVLLVIFVILMLLLRAVVAPALLVLTVLLSFFATLGVCAVVFNHVFHFAGADSSFPLFAFTFLVALGVDYNIFLMTRVRDETKTLGTRRGILKGLTVTGGVITSAGVVLAATFSVLGTLPLVFLAELGFAVAFGVLLDTLVVRTFLVPALTYDIGRPIWWPSRLARLAEPPPPEDGRPSDRPARVPVG